MCIGWSFLCGFGFGCVRRCVTLVPSSIADVLFLIFMWTCCLFCFSSFRLCERSLSRCFLLTLSPRHRCRLCGIHLGQTSSRFLLPTTRLLEIQKVCNLSDLGSPITLFPHMLLRIHNLTKSIMSFKVGSVAHPHKSI